MSLQTAAAVQPAIQPRFALGRVVMTRGIHALVTTGQVNPIPLLRRHVSGDWGDMSEPDKRQNDCAVRGGDDRIMSSYKLSESLKIWIITEWDRSVTTILLPSEY